MAEPRRDALARRVVQLEHQLAAAARNARHRGQHLIEALDVVDALLQAAGGGEPVDIAVRELVAEARATAKDLVHEVTQDAVAWDELDLVALVRAAARRVFKEQLDQLRLTVGDLPRGVHGDASAIEAAFVELLQNAKDFADDPPTVVHVSGLETGRDLRVFVDDDGPGVEPEDRRRIFAYDVDAEDPRYGVGLALVASVMEDHGGSVWCEQAPALDGARFVLQFPAAADLNP